MQRLETSVLRREPASARGVDDQQNLTLEPLQRNVLAGKRLCLQIVNASHGVVLMLVGNSFTARDRPAPTAFRRLRSPRPRAGRDSRVNVARRVRAFENAAASNG